MPPGVVIRRVPHRNTDWKNPPVSRPSCEALLLKYSFLPLVEPELQDSVSLSLDICGLVGVHRMWEFCSPSKIINRSPPIDLPSRGRPPISSSCRNASLLRSDKRPCDGRFLVARSSGYTYNTELREWRRSPFGLFLLPSLVYLHSSCRSSDGRMFGPGPDGAYFLSRHGVHPFYTMVPSLASASIRAPRPKDPESRYSIRKLEISLRLGFFFLRKLVDRLFSCAGALQEHVGAAVPPRLDESFSFSWQIGSLPAVSRQSRSTLEGLSRSSCSVSFSLFFPSLYARLSFL